MALPVFTDRSLSHISPNTIDLVHIHAPFFVGRFLYRWARKHRKPVVFTYHSKFHQKFENQIPFAWMRRRLEHWIGSFVNSCDAITTPSHSFQKSLTTLGIDGSKTTVVPNGVPPPPPLTDGVKAELNAHPLISRVLEARHAGVPVFLYVGQLIQEKNPDLLIHAGFQLKQKSFPFLLIFVGTGDKLAPLKQLRNTLRLQREIVFGGKIADSRIIHYLYSLADLFTFPSTYETQGMVVMEAALHGTPTVGIEGATGICDMVIHHETGFLTQATPQAYAETLIKAIENEALRKTMVDRIQHSVPVSMEAMVSKYVAVYESLLQKQHQMGACAPRS
jgi:glycosyltransferase involved in cell wall biosynthesis